MTGSPLADFLLARFVEDEREAREHQYYQEEVYEAAGWWDCDRVLAECEAKRRIVAVLDMTPCPCQRSERCVVHDASAGPPEFARERYLSPVTETALRALALPYADHPDYRAEWRPDDDPTARPPTTASTDAQTLLRVATRVATLDLPAQPGR